MTLFCRGSSPLYTNIFFIILLGVRVRSGAMVQHVDNDGLMFASNGQADTIAAKTVIWGGGITASPLGKILATRTKAATDKAGKIKVRPNLTVEDYPDVYVVGDLALSADEHGKTLPGLAQVAMQGGDYAAKAILRRVKGQPELSPFRYFDKGSLAVIGRACAVANTFGMHLSGFVAWLVWVFIHLTYLVTFQNRLQVFIQWAIQDITFNRGARLITGFAPTDFNFNREVSGQRGAVDVSLTPTTSYRGQ
jgi:NADH dehydrogenase